MKQPALGIVAALIVMAISLGFISMFSLRRVHRLGCVFHSVHDPHANRHRRNLGRSARPGFAQRGQPLKGILLIPGIRACRRCLLRDSVYHRRRTRQPSGPHADHVYHHLRPHHILARHHVGQLALSPVLFENPIGSGLAMLVACFRSLTLIFAFRLRLQLHAGCSRVCTRA